MVKPGSLIISCLIFVCLIISVWMYKTFSMSHGIEASTAEMQKAVACLRNGFAFCAAGDQVRHLISYRFLSIDKIFLVILSFLTATVIIKLSIDGRLPKEGFRDLCVLASFLFALFLAAQYGSFALKFHIWSYLQGSWSDQGMEILKENCIKGISAADCGLVKKWLDMAGLKAKAIHIFSLLLLGGISMFIGILSRSFLHKSTTEN
ncbi:hypothetical protein [Pseudomonas indica]|uniref:hypothetical protein n=1 Tax=Pseudomonas indica TaxID=137658 RepID=UPI001140CA96|nr:hypothetical protein [Pseudomonas indica]